MPVLRHVRGRNHVDQEADEKEQHHDLDAHHHGVEFSGLFDAPDQHDRDQGDDPEREQIENYGNAKNVRRALDQSGYFSGGAKIGRQPLRNIDPEGVMHERSKIVGPTDRDGHVADRVFEDQVPADDPRDQLSQRRVRIGVGRAGDRHHRRHFGVTERRKGADDGRDPKREHQRWTGARPRSVAGGGGADGGKDARADDRADAQQRDIERPQAPLQ